MKNKTGINAQEVKLLDRKVKMDFKKIFTVLSKTAIMSSVGKYDSAQI